jgi:type VI secretion system protein ImpC
MPTKDTSSSVFLDVNAGREAQRTEAQPDELFRILILGDFSGHANGAGRPQRIDRDNFDDVLRKMDVRLDLPFGKLKFAELADFDPDSIFKRCERFRSEAPAKAAAHFTAPVRSIESDVASITSGSLLDEILEQTEPPAASRAKGGLESVVEQIVAPYRLEREDEASKQARVQGEEHRANLMRAILHHPAFQALESAWRALDMLVRGLDTDGPLSLHVLDAAKAGLDRLPDHERWAIVIGNYVFDRSAEDVELLTKVAALARRAGAPFIAESVAADQESIDTDWRKLRAEPDASWVGLALPRFLIRVPYGRDTYAIESFPFEEIEHPPRHSDYLWANPAFACAYLLGRAFNDHGWGFRPGIVRQIEGLPYHSFEVDGEVRSQPCAEVLLTDREIDYIHDQGLMALASIKNRDAAQLVRFQSIADPLTALAGRWVN